MHGTLAISHASLQLASSEPTFFICHLDLGENPKTNIGEKLRILSRELMFFQKQGKFRKLFQCILSGHIFLTPSKYWERPKCRTPKKQCWNETFFGLFFWKTTVFDGHGEGHEKVAIV